MTGRSDTGSPRTISEKILSSRCGHDVRACDIAVCEVDLVLGTDGSGPMAIDYFEQMGGQRLHDAGRVFFALDHYAPPAADATKAFHSRIRSFASSKGATVFDVGEGISHQLAVERGLVAPGDLAIGADSHTVTCGALNCLAIGVGSSDLAAAMLTGRIWLRVPETIRVRLVGARPPDVAAKDVALALVGELGGDGANYQAIEFDGDLSDFSLADRLVLSSLLVESGAKAAIFPHDDVTAEYRRGRAGDSGTQVAADPGARYARELVVDLASLSPRVAQPHQPDRVAPLHEVAGVPVHMVFIGTCTGGRVQDFREALAAFEGAGGKTAPGVQLVLTPASREVHEQLVAEGILRRFTDAGAVVTTAGCGACCGTSGVIPGDDMTVLSTANRNFKGRMGNASARIYLASPMTCGTAAAIGRIPGAPDLHHSGGRVA
ncbi:MAG TPA: aconitase/3-isopropylmalate dehydratase large subunit family protein [Gemmatimonadaceae bacterium]